MKVTTDFRQLGEDALDRVAALRDEIRLRLHLGSLEAADAWKRLIEPQLYRIEKGLEQAAQASDDAFHHDERGMRLALAMMEVKDRLDAIEPHLRWWREQVLAAGEEAAGTIAAAPDVGRLRAHLARLDAEDALARRKEQARTALADLHEALTATGRRIRGALGMA